jgi:hypothetical protein
MDKYGTDMVCIPYLVVQLLNRYIFLKRVSIQRHRVVCLFVCLFLFVWLLVS